MRRYALAIAILASAMSLTPAAFGEGSVFSSSAQVCEADDRSESLVPKLFSDAELNERIAAIGFAATAEQVQNAPCRSALPSLHEMTAWIVKNGNQDRVKNAKSHGMVFSDERADLIDAFDQLTTFQGKLFTSTEYTFRSSCSDVFCAVKAAFGAQEGILLLYLQLRYGVNASHLANSRSKKLSTSEMKKRTLPSLYNNAHNFRALSVTELKLILQAVSDYPETVFPLPGLKFRRGSQDDNYGVIDTAHAPLAYTSVGQLFTDDRAVTLHGLPVGKGDAIGAEMAIFHEIAHVIARSQDDLDLSSKWGDLSGWLGPVEEQLLTKTNCSVSGYGNKNQVEDFAESVVAYRFHPEALKRKCFEKYEYLRSTIFHGFEYTSQKSCQPKR